MKSIFTLFSLFSLTTIVNAQTISTIEEGILAPNSYYDGSDYSGGFLSGNAYFDNYYDTTWGASFGYWSTGWAYSNIGDTVTQTSNYSQLFSAHEVSGVDSSLNFAVGTQNSTIVLTGPAIGKAVNGFYITNSTYAYNSMKLGDSFAKKFGGTSGNDPDYFKITIKSYLGGNISTDSVEFYLADYRFSDNSQDYIIKNWTWVNLTALGNIDSLIFTLYSSDVGSFGINTPLYYCIDNFTTANSPVGIENPIAEPEYSIFPNPSNGLLNITSKFENTEVEIIDYSGRKILNFQFDYTTNVDLSNLPTGVYSIITNGKPFKWIKR